jgi:predicted DCC family thiol-disulfide oxidoreductase YuxK
MAIPESGVLVFDGECGFCTRALGWIRLLDGEARLTTVPLQGAGVPERIGTTAARCRETVHLEVDGTLHTGADAVNLALAVALRRSFPQRLYAHTAALQERVYDWVSRNRGRLPGTTPWCTRHPASCAG